MHERVDTVRTDDVYAELERALSEHFGATRRVVGLERRVCPYRTSFHLEELDVVLDDGTTLHVMLKDMGEARMTSGAREVKPSFLYDPLREIETYRSILAPAQLSTPTFYGAHVDAERDRYWLFIENVSGDVLWQVGELAIWQDAARWLAAMHAHFADGGDWRNNSQHLLRYDAGFYRPWLGRAETFARRMKAAGQSDFQTGIDQLASCYERVIDRMASLPTTFIHGEFYASNVLVQNDRQVRICPIDWEGAAIGPGLIDLAALSAGAWEEEDRDALVLAYREALADLGASHQVTDDFLTALDCCRLYLAVQWLGWAPEWSPPEEHRQDWLAEALMIADRLEL